MKKLLAMVLMLAHLIAVTGVFASVHYCGHAITHLSIGNVTEEVDCECKEVKKTDCCSDLTIKASAKQEATMAKSNASVTPLQLLMVVFKPYFSQVNSTLLILNQEFNEDSPGILPRAATGIWRI